MLSLPGHQIPGTPRQCGAAATSRIGRSLRAASSSPVAKVPYQAIFGAIFDAIFDAGFDAGSAAVTAVDVTAKAARTIRVMD